MENNNNKILYNRSRFLCVLTGSSAFKITKDRIFNEIPGNNASVLIGKVLKFYHIIDLTNLIDNLSNKNIKKFSIVIISNSHNELSYVKEKGIYIYYFDYKYFLLLLNVYRHFDNKTLIEFKFNNLLVELFHNFEKSNEIKPLFIFEDFSWFTFVKLLKVMDIKITGGSTTKRHLLSTLDYDLFVYADVLFKQCNLKFNEIRKLIFDSYNSKIQVKNSVDFEDITKLNELTDFDYKMSIFLDNMIKLKKFFSECDEIKSSIDDYKNKIKSATNDNKKSYKNKGTDIANYNNTIQTLKNKLNLLEKD